MGFQGRNDKIFLRLLGAVLILSSFVFTTCQCKTVNLKEDSSVSRKGENVFVSLAKSLATEAISEFQSRARRNPKLGFNITMLLPPGFGGGSNGTAEGGTNSTRFGFQPPTRLFGVPTVIGVKAGILGLKAVAMEFVIMILLIVFLLTGIAYFACNVGVISCSDLGGGGGLGNIGGGGLSNPFSRNGYDYHQAKLHRSTSAVYNAIDDSQKKYT